MVNEIVPLINGSKRLYFEYYHPSPKTKLNLQLPHRKIYSRPPHICTNNFFLQDELMDYLVEKRYVMTMIMIMTTTCRKDHFQKG